MFVAKFSARSARFAVGCLEMIEDAVDEVAALER